MIQCQIGFYQTEEKEFARLKGKSFLISLSRLCRISKICRHLAEAVEEKLLLASMVKQHLTDKKQKKMQKSKTCSCCHPCLY